MPRKATGSAQFKDGKFWAIVSLPRKPGQKTAGRKWIECPEAIKSLPKAKEYAAWLTEQLRAGKITFDNPAEEKPSIGESFQQWSERWLDARETKGLISVKDDRGRLKNHVWKLLGDKPIKHITTADLEAVRDSLDEKIRNQQLSWKTAANTWGLVTVAFAEATLGKNKDLRLLTSNPARDIVGPDRGTKLARQYLYPDEFLKLVSSDNTPERWAILFALAVYTGLRAGELEALTWSDVDFAHQILSITKAVNRKTNQVGRTKSKETRRVPIEPELLPLLRRLHRQAGEGCGDRRVVWLPPDEDRAEGLRRYLERARVARAGLLKDSESTRKITLHDLRGTYLTWCAVRGDAPLVIQQRAGHAMFSTTEGYIREAEHVAAGGGFGRPFPALPGRLLG